MSDIESNDEELKKLLVYVFILLSIYYNRIKIKILL